MQQSGRPEAITEILAPSEVNGLSATGFSGARISLHVQRITFFMYFIGRKESRANPIQLNKHMMGLDV